jgi:hypothetical protein
MRHSEPPDRSSSRPQSGRSLAFFGLVLFGVSLLFPVAAGLLRAEQMPQWLGWLDVGLAVAMALMLMRIDSAGRTLVDDRARLAAHLLLLLLILFFLAADRVRWDVLLVGLAWRFWLGADVLPAGLALWNR